MLTVSTNNIFNQKYFRNITRTLLTKTRKNFEFRENTKMLTVLTDNIIDQNHFVNIIRTSLSNSRNSFGPI